MSGINSSAYHEVNVAVIFDEVLHQLFEAVLFFVHLTRKKNAYFLNTESICLTLIFTMLLFPLEYKCMTL